VRPATDAKGGRLESDLDLRAGPVSADRLQQVFWNVLINAIKFTPSKGMVAVQLHGVETAVEVVIRDPGQCITSAISSALVWGARSAPRCRCSRKRGAMGLAAPSSPSEMAREWQNSQQEAATVHAG